MKADRSARTRAGKSARKSTAKKKTCTKAVKGSNGSLSTQVDKKRKTPRGGDRAGRYRPRSIEKRTRRSPVQIAALKDEIQAFRAEMKAVGVETVSVRQVFYMLETREFVAKSENGYHQVVHYLTQMREDGSISSGWISDATRWRRELITHANPPEFISNSMGGYRRDPWQDINARVEIWLEKEALASVFTQITEKWCVSLMATKGYSSLSFIQEAAFELEIAYDSPAFIYFFGDHDPSGRDIARDVEARLRKHAPNTEIHFECVAVTPKQIKAWNLPKRPTKSKDSRAKGFEGKSVELDSIPPAKLFPLIENCISQHIPDGCWEQHLEQEAKDIEILEEAASVARLSVGDFSDLSLDDDNEGAQTNDDQADHDDGDAPAQ